MTTTPEERAREIVQALDWERMAYLIAIAIREARNAALEEAAAYFESHSALGKSSIATAILALKDKPE